MRSVSFNFGWLLVIEDNFNNFGWFRHWKSLVLATYTVQPPQRYDYCNFKI